MDDLVFSVEIIHSCTYFSFLPGSNDRCLSTTILFSNKPWQEIISIFGGNNIIHYFIIVVLWCILTKVKGLFLTLFLKAQTICDHSSCSAFMPTTTPKLFTKLSTEQFLKPLSWHHCTLLAYPSSPHIFSHVRSPWISNSYKWLKPIREIHSLKHFSPLCLYLFCAGP